MAGHLIGPFAQLTALIGVGQQGRKFPAKIGTVLHLDATAPFFHLVPAFGSVMAIVFLGEQPQLFHVIGFALVLTGVFVASRSQSAGSG